MQGQAAVACLVETRWDPVVAVVKRIVDGFAAFGPTGTRDLIDGVLVPPPIRPFLRERGILAVGCKSKYMMVLSNCRVVECAVRTVG